ncbi:MAG TPA: NAD(+)/NADH kinase [Kofleriaceae bacterium]|nr:NAD(+)/NADH kinase [Kofleriaceae bacterium]
MNRVGFILKPQSAEAAHLLGELVPWLIGRGVQAVVIDTDGVSPPGAQVVPEGQLAAAIDIAVVLGGDGTMLRASALVADHGVPVLGINLGRLGFLTPFDPAEARGAIVAALAGRLRRIERSRLQVTFHPAAGGATQRPALNDAVIHQGGAARLIELEARLDGVLIEKYRVDGLIVCTPSGSTAYNLAAGGPILTPGQAAMVLTPICAHALTNRPVVVPQSGTISVTLGGEGRTAVLTVDGQWVRPFSPGDRVDITATARPLRVFQSDKNFFDILREKLHWGARTER